MEYLSFGIRLWLAMVCAVAVLGKVRSRRSFGAFVTSLESAARAVPLVRAPARFARRLAPPVLAAEIAVAVLSPLPATAVLGCVLAVGLFGVFTAGVGVAVATGADASCACFGRITTKLGVAARGAQHRARRRGGRGADPRRWPAGSGRPAACRRLSRPPWPRSLSSSGPTSRPCSPHWHCPKWRYRGEWSDAGGRRGGRRSPGSVGLALALVLARRYRELREALVATGALRTAGAGRTRSAAGRDVGAGRWARRCRPG